MSMLTPPGVGGRPRARRRGHSRHRGRKILVLLVLLTAAAVVAGWLWNQHDETTVAGVQRPTCPPTHAAPTTVAARSVHLNVYNATKRRGLATEIAVQLRKRGFVVGKIGNDPAGRTVTGVAELRNGPTGAAAARTVGAVVTAYVAAPDQRKDASVDLVLGAGFRALRTPAAAAAALSPTPSPRPSGC